MGKRKYQLLKLFGVLFGKGGKYMLMHKGEIEEYINTGI